MISLSDRPESQRIETEIWYISGGGVVGGDVVEGGVVGGDVVEGGVVGGDVVEGGVVGGAISGAVVLEGTSIFCPMHMHTITRTRSIPTMNFFFMFFLED